MQEKNNNLPKIQIDDTSEEVGNKTQETNPNLFKENQLEITDSKDIQSKGSTIPPSSLSPSPSPSPKPTIKKLPIIILLTLLIISIISITTFLILQNLNKNQKNQENQENQKNQENPPVLPPEKTEFHPTIGLCVPAKHENKYIREFVEYYKALNVTKIYIYDNNEKTYEKVDTRIQDYIDEGYVTILYKEIEGDFYNHIFNNECYQQHKDEFDWMFFFDVDEFMYINTNESFTEYLSNDQFKDCDLILINWVIYDDNDELTYSDRPCVERFTRPMMRNQFWNKFVKSIIRTSVKAEITDAHIVANVKKTCNSKGKLITPTYQRIFDIDTEYAFIKHFCYKSCEEYIDKLVKFNTFKLKDKDAVKMFFCKNIVTEEKIKFFEKVFQVNLDEYRSKIGAPLNYY